MILKFVFIARQISIVFHHEINSYNVKTNKMRNQIKTYQLNDLYKSFRNNSIKNRTKEISYIS